MSIANLAADFGSTRTVALATKTLSPAPSRARRTKFSEGLGGASAFPLLGGALAGAAAMIYTGVTTGTA